MPLEDAGDGNEKTRLVRQIQAQESLPRQPGKIQALNTKF